MVSTLAFAGPSSRSTSPLAPPPPLPVCSGPAAPQGASHPRAPCCPAHLTRARGWRPAGKSPAPPRWVPVAQPEAAARQQRVAHWEPWPAAHKRQNAQSHARSAFAAVQQRAIPACSSQSSCPALPAPGCTLLPPAPPRPAPPRPAHLRVAALVGRNVEAGGGDLLRNVVLYDLHGRFNKVSRRLDGQRAGQSDQQGGTVRPRCVFVSPQARLPTRAGLRQARVLALPAQR